MLKRLEIQCVFKELVKDIVVKGHLLFPFTSLFTDKKTVQRLVLVALFGEASS